MKDELLRAVWPDSFVEEANLPVAISTIRKTLGEKEGGPRYVETVPTKGYRFVAPVREVKQQAVVVREGKPLPASTIAAQTAHDAIAILAASENQTKSITPAARLTTSPKYSIRWLPWPPSFSGFCWS